MVFVCMFVFLSHSEAGTLFVRGVHSSNKHCVAAYRLISTRFSAFFQMHYIVFIFLSLDGATSFAKLRSKIAESPKIGGKGCGHHFVSIAQWFKENSTATVYGRE